MDYSTINNQMQESGGRSAFSVNVTTYGLSFFSNDTNMPMMLSLSFADDTLSISFRAGVQDPSTGKTKYPKENTVSTLLNVENVYALDQVIRHSFLPAYEKKEQYNGGVWPNNAKNKILEIACDENGEAYLVLHTGIHPDTKQPQRTIVFKFERKEYIEMYRPGGNEHTVSIIDAQLMLFIKTVETFLFAAARSIAHFGRVADNYDRNKCLRYLSDMGNKLGIAGRIERQDANSYNSGGNVSYGVNTNSYLPNNNTPAIQPLNGIEELIPNGNNEPDLPF